MTPEDLTKITVVAQHHSDELPREAFRFKNEDAINKGNLQEFRNHGLIEARDDAWSTTTWEWTDDGEYALAMCETTPITEATDKQLKTLREYGKCLQQLPVGEEFLASEYGLRGQKLQTLSGSGLLEKADESGQIIVWTLSEFTVRIITSIEARELDAGNFRTVEVAAD